MPRRKASDQVEALRQSQTDSAAKLKDAAAVERENRREEDRRRQELAGRVALAYADAKAERASRATL